MIFTLPENYLNFLIHSITQIYIYKGLDPPAPYSNACFFLFAKQFLYQEINTKTLLEKSLEKKTFFNKLHAVSRGVCPEKGKKIILSYFRYELGLCVSKCVH